MKKNVILMLLMMACTGMVAQTVLDRVVAVVDREIITESDLNYAVQMMAVQSKVDPDTPGLKDRILDGLINEKLILAQAIEDSVIVTDEEVADRLDRQIKLLVQQYGSEQRLEELYNMPISRMKRDFREEIRKQLLIQKIRQTREVGLTVSRREVEAFFETNRDSLPTVPQEFEMSHIFVKPKPDSASEKSVYSLALSILDSIRAGGDFADFAKRYSSDVGSAVHGGDLGSVRRGSFVKEFEEVVFSMKENELSKPVKTQFGYHIIQLLERRGESVHPRHILFPIKQTSLSDDTTMAELKRLRDRVLHGEDFGVLARKYSEDPESKDIGGDLGRIPADQIEPSFMEVLKPLKSGDISQPAKVPVGSSYGYHIVYLRTATKEHPMNLADDYRRLEQFALQFKSNGKHQIWLEELRKTIYWEKKL
ncbi:MAG: peptidylprolyl isomerase [Ignavibacteriales bacterium]|nr:peptidylprolyl isomerase [Ignavibacteriales bacterium]